MKKFLVLASMMLSISLAATAQSMPKRCSAFKPNQLIKESIREADIQQLKSSDYGQTQKSTSKHWIVYSDRENNQTYVSSTGNATKEKLKLNEKLRIAEIANGRALVYSEPVAKTSWPRISADAVCRGWIPMDNLLLWDVCLSDEHGVYEKALLCLNGNFKGSDRGYGYLNPNESANKIELDPTFRIYYVVKKASVNGMKVALLASQSKMEGYSSQNLYAWVPEKMYISWNQRTCLERTWDKEDIKTLAKSGYSAYIYSDEYLRNKVTEPINFEVSKSDPHPNEDDEFYRWPGEAMRYPILDGTKPESDKYECSALIGNAGGAFIDPTLKIKKEILENRSHVNIIILLDATKSMNEFATSVYNAIKSGCDYFENSFTVKIGVMLYRDRADGQYETEWFNFTKSTDPSLLKFIQEGGKYGYASSPSDKTNTESLFYGMNEALRRFRNPKESNMLMVVGDCGNNQSDTRVNQEALINAIVTKNVNVVGFQVEKRRDNADWECFNTDLVQIIRKSLQKKYDNIDKGSVVSAKPFNDRYEFKNTQDPENYLFVAEHRTSLTNQRMKPDKLRELMTGVIGGYSAKIQELLDAIVRGGANVRFGGKTSDSKGPVTISEKWLEQIFGTTDVSGLVGFTGWTPKMKDDIKIWKSDVFFTHEELSELISGLEPLYLVARNTTNMDRKPFVDAVKKSVKKMAPGVNISDKNIDDLLQRVMGINEPTPIMKHPISDVLDNQKIKDPEYRLILSTFKKNYETLKRIVENSRYPYKMEYNRVTYYWIPVEDMP